MSENTSYLNALKLIDTGLGQLLATIEARKDAYYEDWLVCVTSNHGGTPDGHYGGNTDQERDIFGIFYYPHYTSYEMKGGNSVGGIFLERGLGSSGRLYRFVWNWP